LRILSTLFQVILLILTVMLPAQAKAALSTDKRLNDLSLRFNAFESYWNRFQMGGTISVKSTTGWEPETEKLNVLNFNQQLELFFNTFVDQNLGLSVRLSHSGGWGLKYQTSGSSDTPMSTPLQLDEAFLRREAPNNLDFLGRFRFSLTPLGLFSDFSVSPVEGAAFQKIFGSYHAILLYSRIYTEYDQNANRIAANEDYWSGRFGWSNHVTTLGINLVPNGLAGEKEFGFDASYTRSNWRITTELGWYSYNSNDPRFSLYKVGWTPGILTSFSQTLSSTAFYQIKAGYISEKFMPRYSSLAHDSGDNREWFLPNMQGVEFFLKNQLKPGWFWENRCLVSQQITHYTGSDLDYRCSSSLRKLFSPVNQLQFGAEFKNYPVSDNHIFLNWELRF
jgi:hypothetical protein